MIAKLKAAYAKFIATKVGAVVNRAVILGLLAFAGTFVKGETDAQLLTPAHYLDLSLWHVTFDSAIAAGIGAVLAFAQSSLWTLFAGAPQLTSAKRANFKARRAARRG